MSESEQLQFKRTAVAAEVDHRREKQWKIFSWSASLLTAITGGVIALKVHHKLEMIKLSKDIPALSCYHKTALLLGVVGLSSYSLLWLRQNWKLEQKAEKNLCTFDCQLGLDPMIRTLDTSDERFQRGLWFGYYWALGLLLIGSVMAILLDV